MAIVSWMWADASFIGGGIAAKNPLRWSKKQSIAVTVADLEQCRAEDKQRPIRIQFHADDLSSPAAASDNHQEFANTEGGAEFLRARLADSEASPSRPRLLSSRTSVELPFTQESLRSHFDRVVQGQRISAARWMWGDSGATSLLSEYRVLAEKNPLRWSPMQSLPLTISDLEAITAQRPVTIELTSAGGSAARSNAPSPSDAVVVLRALLEQQHCLRGREEFREEPGVTIEDSEYGQYVQSVLDSHGGAKGASVRFMSTEPFMSLRSGMEGRIQEFDGLHSFSVDWGAASVIVSLVQCTLIATSDNELRLSGVEVESVLQSTMGTLVEEMNSGNLRRFESACKRLLGFQDDRARYHAITAGVCEAAIATMAANSLSKNVQHAGCMAIWWIAFPVSSDAEACREHAFRSGTVAVLAEAAKAYPDDSSLQDCCRQAICYVVDGHSDRSEAAIGAGIPAAWVQFELVA